jgi:hypothetical protein
VSQIPATGGAGNSHELTATPPQLIGLIKAHIAKGDKAADKAEQHYIAAGQHLKQLKAEHDGHDGTWAEWEELLKEKIGIGKSRASELMRIADGTKTIEQVRADTTERTAKTRALQSSPLRSGENADDPETSAEIMKAKFAATDGAAAVDDADGSAPSPLVPAPAVPSEGSWRVELTTDDGKRLVNGVRFKTKAEAVLYASRSTEELLSPLWRPTLRTAGYEIQLVMMTRVLASGDVANCDMKFPKGRRGEVLIYFPDGGCHLFRWRPEGDADEPSCSALPTTGEGNGSDPEQSAAKRREPKAVSP